MKLKKTLVILLSLCMCLSFMTACGGNESDKPDKIVIATQELMNAEAITKQEGYFTELMGSEVEIMAFSSGREVLTALTSGDADFGIMGSCPTALGAATNVDYKIIWTPGIMAKSEACVVRDSLNIKDISDLKGKTIAVPFASNPHYELLQGLASEGLKAEDVKLLDMQPDEIYAAFLRGDIDVAYTWNPSLANILAEGDCSVLFDAAYTESVGYPTADFAVVRSEFAEKYPDLVTAYVEALAKGADMLANDNEAAMKIIAERFSISPEEAIAQMTDKYLTAEEQLGENYFGGDAMKNMVYNIAMFLYEQGEITEEPDEEAIKALVTGEYIEQVVNK